MALYAIIRSERAINNDALATNIAKKYAFYRLGKGQWIVSADDSAKGVCQSLGITPGQHYGGTLVLLVEDYFGLHDKKLWEWLKKFQPPLGE